jgi:hypothetical protein
MHVDRAGLSAAPYQGGVSTDPFREQKTHGAPLQTAASQCMTGRQTCRTQSLIANGTPGVAGGSARSVQRHYACDPLMSPKTK